VGGLVLKVIPAPVPKYQLLAWFCAGILPDTKTMKTTGRIGFINLFIISTS
jgi:hypothetical protein